MAHSMRKEYDEHGITGYYEKFGCSYRNKHGPEIKRVMRLVVVRFPADLKSRCPIKVLDLACGSGEATVALLETKITDIDHVEGSDPFTYEAFEQVCGKTAFRWSFEDIADGILNEKRYDLSVCSFALHLLDVSKVFGCCYQLALSSQYLLILTPHKRPVIKAEMGWDLILELVEERIHARLYRSNLWSDVFV